MNDWATIFTDGEGEKEYPDIQKKGGMRNGGKVQTSGNA
jgi:hypothetical protein